MYVVIFIDDGLIEGVYTYTNKDRAERKQKRLSKFCSDPRVSFVRLVKTKPDSDEQEKGISSLPPDYIEEEDTDE